MRFSQLELSAHQSWLARYLPSLFLLAALLSLTGCSGSHATAPLATGPDPAIAPASWVIAWGNSPENAFPTTINPGGNEQSFRFVFYPTVAGIEERVHFTNILGTTPLTIGSARLAVATGTGTAIDPKRDAPLTFNGSTTVTIPAGQAIVSDPVKVTYAFGEKMAVTMYMPGAFPPLTQHSSDATPNYATPAGAGDTTTDTVGASFTQTISEWYLLSSVDVYGEYQGTVVLFGSSTIEGHESNLGDTNSYPTPNVAVPNQDNDRPSDWLARQLHTAGYQIGVLNAGILADPAGPNSGANSTTGILDGIDRVHRDALQQLNVKAVILYLGSIDIRSGDCKSAPDVEASLTNIVAQIHAAGVRVIFGTLPPAAYCQNQVSPNYGPVPSSADPYAGDLNPGPENPGATQRRLVNTWIRTTGATLPGVVAIADFDHALADPAHPDFLQPNLNAGDNTHPNGPGYGVQSSAIPLKAILGY